MKKFSPLAEIPGHAMPPGAILVTADSRRRLLIPRWIGGYAMCKERFKSGGPHTSTKRVATRISAMDAGFLFLRMFEFSDIFLGRVLRQAPGKPLAI